MSVCVCGAQLYLPTSSSPKARWGLPWQVSGSLAVPTHWKGTDSDGFSVTKVQNDSTASSCSATYSKHICRQGQSRYSYMTITSRKRWGRGVRRIKMKKSRGVVTEKKRKKKRNKDWLIQHTVWDWERYSILLDTVIAVGTEAVSLCEFPFLLV